MSKNRYQIDFVFAVGIFSDEFVYSKRDIFGDNIVKSQHPFQNVLTCVSCSFLHGQNLSGKNYKYMVFLQYASEYEVLAKFCDVIANIFDFFCSNGYLNFPSSVCSNSPLLSLFLISRHF